MSLEEKIDYNFLIKKLNVDHKITYLPFPGLDPLPWSEAASLLETIVQNSASKVELLLIENLIQEIHDVKLGNNKTVDFPTKKVINESYIFYDVYMQRNNPYYLKKIVEKVYKELRKV